MVHDEDPEPTTEPAKAAAAERGASGAPTASAAAAAIARVIETVRTMVSPGGCAWHEVQTHASLMPYLVEETAEFIDAVERELPAAEVRSELGDVLYQVVFHAAIAERDGEGYDLASVADALNDKLISRHPHVFGDRGYMSVEELHAEWERLKEDAAGDERGSRGPLDGIPAGMPTLARAAKVVERLKRARLVEIDAVRPPGSLTTTGPIGRIAANAGERSATDPLADVIGPHEERLAEVGIGDAMLALVTRANAVGVDPDRALRLATERLAARALHTES